MLQAFTKRREDDEQGFTLIELMVVVLIIAILLAIAIPTFLGARERAANRAAQSDIRNTLTAQKTVYTDNQSFVAWNYDGPDTDAIAELTEVEPQITYAATPGSTTTVGITEVSLDLTNDPSTVDPLVDTYEMTCISKKATTGRWFMLVEVAVGASAGTYYRTAEHNSDAAGAPSPALPACNAATATAIGATPTPAGWSKTGF